MRRSRELHERELQAVVDSVWKEVRSFLPEIEPRMVERVPVQFINGPRLEYPRWFLEHDDHKLQAVIRQTFAPYPFPPMKLQHSFMTLNLIPEELWDIFQRVVGVQSVRG